MIEGLQPYPEMQDSGIPWLGTGPAHWDARRLKSMVSNVVDLTSERGRTDLYIALEHVESWTGRIKPTASDTPFDSSVKRFRAGDVLFGKLRPYLAKVAQPESAGVCVGEFLVLRARTSWTTGSYIEWLLRSKPIIDAISGSTFGAKMPRADWHFIGDMTVSHPPLAEQAAIVRFLRHVDRRIRRYIHAKQKLIKLLEEQKQAIIHQAVTRGLDPNVRLKRSGVGWLGDVPEHWTVASLRFRYEQCLGKMVDSKKFTGTRLLPYLRNVDVQWDRINTDGLPSIDISEREHDRFTLRRDDLLVCEGRHLGRAAIWGGELPVCAFQKALHRLRANDTGTDLPRYLYYCLYVVHFQDAFGASSRDNSIPHLTGEMLRAFKFPFPPLSEQSAIAAYLDASCAIVERAQASLAGEHEAIRDYRTRLIADVVTGKLDVREAATRIPDEGDGPEGVDEVEDDVDAAEASDDELDGVLVGVEA